MPFLFCENLKNFLRTLLFSIFIGVPLISISGCGEKPKQLQNHATVLDVWVHSGQASERAAIEGQIKRFNAANNAFQVKLTFIPERTYNAQVQAAAVAGELPDILEFDGPFLYNYVWQGHIRPLDDLLDSETKKELLISIVEQGTYQNKLYAVGTFDSGLGLYARHSALKKIGARIPKDPSRAWTVKEFKRILTKLAPNDPDRAVLDLKLNYSGEWFTYAYSPIIQSAGDDLIDRSAYLSANNKLNGFEATRALTIWQDLLRQGYVDPNVDDGAFVMGRVALSWAGHWEYARYKKAVGKDLLVLPLPDFGLGSKTAQGSWVWGISQSSDHPIEAAKFLTFLLSTEEVLAMANANGAVPATYSAIQQSKLYKRNGPLRLFVEQLTEGYAIPRPKTPAYPVITNVFQQAMLDIRNGADVKQALDKAVIAIDQDIQDNKGYGQTMGSQ